MKLIIQLVLWVVIIFLGYLVFNSVYGPVEFNEAKEARYTKVIEKLKDIRNAEQAHYQVTGKYTGSFDSLVRFIDTAEYTLTQRRDSVVLDEEYKRIYKIDQYKTIRVIDTIGKASVKDSLFGNDDRYKNLGIVKIEGKDVQIDLNAGTITKNEAKFPVFEAKVAKEKVLYDQPKDMIMQEKQVVSVDGVNGEFISVGSMTEVTDKGNWPTTYDAATE
ncbi:MAG TPA: hypothetical protein VFM70_11100 [Salinimicrobium sp.]|nr:hypothetical protein [Salinimicrobium sp.]